MTSKTTHGLLGLAAACSVAVASAPAASAAPALTTLVSFDGSSGNIATAGLTLDAAGNLYGATLFGGDGNQLGSGTVFELSGADHGTFRTLVTFNGSNGGQPAAALTIDSSGNLYGTTEAGGTAGTGVAFRLADTNHHNYAQLASFSGANGSTPIGGLAFDAPGHPTSPGGAYQSGPLFGTTSAGGAHGDGTVFMLSGYGHATLTTVATFDVTNGSKPGATLVADAAGDLYGTTFTGGPGTYGTVFKLSGPGHAKLTTLVAFSGPNGANPVGGLILDAAGNLYGTTEYGGPGGGGTVFELAGPDHTQQSILASFGSDDPNGAVPQGTLLMDAAGNLFGTTNGGADEFGGAYLGTVFKLPAGHKKLVLLYAFTGKLDGDVPQAGLVADEAGNLYGTTTSGGASGDGTVFDLSGVGFATRAK